MKKEGKNWELILGDCTEKLKKIPDNSIDLIFTDPPYGVALREGSKETIKLFRHSSKNTVITEEWDRFPDYQKFCHSWISECDRVLRPKGWLCIWNDFRRISDIQIVCDKYGFELADMLTWAKTNAPLTFPIGLIKSCEYCLIFYKKSKDKNYQKYLSKSLLRNYLLKPITPTRERIEGGYHPTVKSRAVLYPLIEKYSREGDIVLDPFSGSGSIIVSAIELNRKSIGIEKEKDYYDISLKRINNISKQNNLNKWV